MINYFSSDWHLGHANVIKFDKRPYDNIEAMNEGIIANHNAIVSSTDNFYFLGDFSFANKSRTEEWMSRVNGNKFFISGNHDKKDTIKLYEKYGTYLGGYAEINIKGWQIILAHYAFRVWNRSHHGSLHLYAHSHGSLEGVPWGRSQDVCITLNDYKPFSEDQIIANLSNREIHKEDHHGKREQDRKEA